MGAIIAIAVAIGSAIASAVAAIASAITTAVSAIASAVASVFGSIWGAISAVGSWIWEGISYIATQVASVVSSIISSIGETLATWYTAIVEYVEALYGAMQAFAEAIHLDVILTIHDIAYLVSEDYREMINKFYAEFAKISEALGLGAQFINLAIRNARSVILDVSALMGRTYDIGEITWLKSLSHFTRRIQGKMMDYKDRPEELFTDIDRWLLRDTVNAGAHVQQSMFVLLKKTTEVAHETVQDVVEIRDDLKQFVSDLPKQIREEVGPWVNSVTEKIDSFLEDEYWPYKQKLDAIIDVLDNKQVTVKNRVDGIVDRLTRPGDVLKNVDFLPIEERIQQENKISEVAARSSQRQADDLQAQAAPTWESLQKVRQALAQAPPPPEYIIRERRKPVVPAGQQSKEADTWFVGDY